jgi:hypothetical protein
MITNSEYPTFYETIVNSDQWRLWVVENEQNPKWDVHESMEIGALSPGHWLAFLNFCRTYENRT